MVLEKDLYHLDSSREKLAPMGESRGEYRVLVAESEGKRHIGKPRRRCKDNNKTDLQEEGYGGMEWIYLAQDTDKRRGLVNAVMYLGFHKMRGISWPAENRLASQEGVRK